MEDEASPKDARKAFAAKEEGMFLTL
ncbi:hypothetical protein NKH95_17590 [Mesorhizobium sp. M0848]